MDVDKCQSEQGKYAVWLLTGSDHQSRPIVTEEIIFGGHVSGIRHIVNEKSIRLKMLIVCICTYIHTSRSRPTLAGVGFEYIGCYVESETPENVGGTLKEVCVGKVTWKRMVSAGRVCNR